MPRAGHLALSAMVLAGCGTGYGRALKLEGDVVYGEVLYLQHCETCHGDTGFGGIGPSLVERLPILEDEEVLAAIDAGPEDMPAFADTFTNQDLADLLSYLTSAFE